jgi:hypothetical protein
METPCRTNRCDGQLKITEAQGRPGEMFTFATCAKCHRTYRCFVTDDLERVKAVIAAAPA